MVVIRRTWVQQRIKTRKTCKGQSAAPATFGPVISPTTAVTAGPIVVSEGGLSSYTHVQNTPLATWTVTHNLGRRPNVSVRSTGGLQILDPEVLHLTANTLTITFDIAFAGEAYCN